MKLRLWQWALCFLVSTSVLAQTGSRRVTVPWRAIPKVQEYEFQLATNPDMDPLLLTKKTKATQAVLKLKPATYYFRIRGFEKKVPGPWSQVEAFAVNPSAPELISPGNREKFTRLLPEEGIHFTWEEGVEGTEYLFEVSDKKGVVMNRRVSGNEVDYMPDRPGVYIWRVGYRSPTGVEWSGQRVFVALRSSFPRAVLRETLLQRGDETEFWLFGRAIQSIVAYTSNDVDLDVQNTAAALVGGAAAELKWGGPRARNSPWRMAANLDVAVYRQIILNAEFLLPRVDARYHFLRTTSKWRWGPTVNLVYKRMGIFVLSPQQTREGTTNRYGAGGGFMGIFDPSQDFNVLGELILRYDFGGSSDQLPSAPRGALGFEFGVGVAYQSSPTLEFLGRFRVINEQLPWGSTRGTSAITSNFVNFEIGAGFRL